MPGVALLTSVSQEVLLPSLAVQNIVKAEADDER